MRRTTLTDDQINWSSKICSLEDFDQNLQIKARQIEPGRCIPVLVAGGMVFLKRVTMKGYLLGTPEKDAAAKAAA